MFNNDEVECVSVSSVQLFYHLFAIEEKKNIRARRRSNFGEILPSNHINRADKVDIFKILLLGDNEKD